jgi:hypothetical protein
VVRKADGGKRDAEDDVVRDAEDAGAREEDSEMRDVLDGGARAAEDAGARDPDDAWGRYAEEVKRAGTAEATEGAARDGAGVRALASRAAKDGVAKVPGAAELRAGTWDLG